MGTLIRMGLLLTALVYGSKYFMDTHTHSLEGRVNAQVERALAKNMP